MSTLIGFVEPLFLWGLFVTGIVFLLHLLRRPKFRKLAFSTLRFFNEAAVKHSRSRALDKLLLLIVRCLIVILICLIFAGIYLRKDPFRILFDPSRDLCIWIDPTLSMLYRDTDGSLSHKAQKVVDSLHSLFPGRQIYRLSTVAPEIVPFDSASRGMYETFTADALEKACTKALDGTIRPILLMMSDFQEPAAQAVEKVLSRQVLADMPVLCIPFTPQKPWNCSVGKIMVMQGNEPFVSTQITLNGDCASTGILQVIVDDQPGLPVVCTLPAQSDTMVTITVAGMFRSGWGKSIFTIDDPLQFDNSAYFTTTDRKIVSILIVGASAENYPLAAAIAVLSPSGERSSAQCTHESLTREHINTADIIIINGSEGAGRSLRMIEKTAVRKKQIVITALDSHTTVAVAKLGWKTAVSPISVRLADTLSMIWHGFTSLQCGGVAVYGYADVPGGIPLLTLANRDVLASYNNDSANRVMITIATPIAITSANNLCETGFYLPFIDRLLRFSESARNERNNVWIAGKPLKNPYYGATVPVALLDSAGKQVALLQQQEHFTIDYPGVYTVARSDASPDQILVIPDTLESRLVYRIPDLHPAGTKLRSTITPNELLHYCATHHKGIGWMVPWLILMVLFGIELFLRESLSAKIRHKSP